MENWFPILLKQAEYEKIINLYKTKGEKYKTSKICYYCAIAYEKSNNEIFAQSLYKDSFELDSTNINSACAVAKILFNQQVYTESEDLIYKILKRTDDDRAFYLLAEICFINKNLDEAIKNYSYAVNINPKIAEYYFKLGIAYSLKGFFNEAEQSFCTALTLEPDNINYNYTLAYLYYTNKKYALAEKLTDYILKLEDKNINAISLNILLLTEKNNITEAKKYIEKLNTIKNQEDFSWYAQALYYGKLNLWNKAVYSANKAVELNENSLEYRFELAKDYYYLENYSLALKNCNELIEKNNKYLPAYILSAKVCYKTAEYQMAEEILNKALKLDINCADIYFIKGDIFYAQSHYEKAIEQYKTGLSINPKEKKYYENIAKCYYMLENYKDSYEYYKEASEFDISNVEIRYYMAKCAVQNSDKQSALTNFSLMKRLAPNNIFYIEEYAEYLKEIGNKKSAVKLLNQLEKTVNTREEKAQIKKIINDMKKNG